MISWSFNGGGFVSYLGPTVMAFRFVSLSSLLYSFGSSSSSDLSNIYVCRLSTFANVGKRWKYNRKSILKFSSSCKLDNWTLLLTLASQAPAPHSTLTIWFLWRRIQNQPAISAGIICSGDISQRSDLPSSWPEQGRNHHCETSLPWREEEARNPLLNFQFLRGEEREATNVSSEGLRSSSQAVLTREELITPLQSLSQACPSLHLTKPVLQSSLLSSEDSALQTSLSRPHSTLLWARKKTLWEFLSSKKIRG